MGCVQWVWKRHLPAANKNNNSCFLLNLQQTCFICCGLLLSHFHLCFYCISASIELIEKKKQLKLCIQLVCLVNIRHIKLISPWKPRKSKRTTRQTWARATFMKVINRRLARAMPARKCNICLATKRNFPLGDNYGHG